MSVDERIIINREIARARREIIPQPVTVAALAELETVRDLHDFRELKHSRFGPAFPPTFRPAPPRPPDVEPFDATGKLASSERVHQRRFVLLTAMSAKAASAAELVNSLGDRYAVRCSSEPIKMAAQDLAYLKKIGRVEKVGGCRDAKWVRIR